MILDHRKAFLNLFISDAILSFEKANHCPALCLGGWEKEISSEEFSFENINNLTWGKGLKIFTVILMKSHTCNEILVYVAGLLQVGVGLDWKI